MTAPVWLVIDNEGEPWAFTNPEAASNFARSLWGEDEDFQPTRVEPLDKSPTQEDE